MNDNFSPEERLLKLIRGQKKQSQAPDKSAARENYEASAQLINKSKVEPVTAFKKYFPSINIRKTIFWLFMFSIVCLVITFIYPRIAPRSIQIPQLREADSDNLDSQSKQNIKPFDFYLEGIKGRRIFATFSGQNTEKPINALSPGLLKDINLVGIISGDSPQAIIEDKKTKETFYATKGQFIGEIQIEDIQAGKIIVNYQNQRYELYL